MAFASVSDIQELLTRDLSADEQAVAAAMLEHAGVMLCTLAPKASAAAKRLVSCWMVIRALDIGSAAGVPMGATQGSMSGLGYSQSWTMGSGGGAGDLYLTKAERRLLGLGNAVGSYSPVEALVPEATL